MPPLPLYVRLAIVLGLVVPLVACGPTPLETAPPLADLDWTTPVDTLGGHSLAQVVGSSATGRQDGRLCSDCHFGDSVTFYRPHVGQGEAAEVGPWDVLDGRSWGGPGGWGERFVDLDSAEDLNDKPPELRDAVAAWLDSDAHLGVGPVQWGDALDPEVHGVGGDPAIEGRSLRDVVSSWVSGRPDGLLCADCHHRGADIAYRPDVAPGEGRDLWPDELLDGRTWAGPGGWADAFVAHGPGSATEKPGYLRAVVHRWRIDGEG